MTQQFNESRIDRPDTTWLSEHDVGKAFADVIREESLLNRANL